MAGRSVAPASWVARVRSGGSRRLRRRLLARAGDATMHPLRSKVTCSSRRELPHRSLAGATVEMRDLQTFDLRPLALVRRRSDYTTIRPPRRHRYSQRYVAQTREMVQLGYGAEHHYP